MTEADLSVFWSTPNADLVDGFVWDTDVPQVTVLWPHMELNRFDLRTVVHALSGRVDTTEFLYELAELEKALMEVEFYEVEDDGTQVLESVGRGCEGDE